MFSVSCVSVRGKREILTDIQSTVHIFFHARGKLFEFLYILWKKGNSC
ncbi:hypothetical protein RV02_GL001010 [Enterococcus gilvus]|nr:hypothetical protein RV02_GL001010 [Enterococcus gilvus]